MESIRPNSIEEFFGTLQQSVVEEWRKHLKTSKYSKHMALDEFYTEMPDMVDKLIEDYQGINGKVEEYVNVFDAEDMDALEYLETLRDFVKAGREDFIEGETSLESDVDDILGFINSIIYKVRELSESHRLRSLKDFISESMHCSHAGSF